MEYKGYYTASEAAKYLEMSLATFNRRVQSGMIKSSSTLQRDRRYTREELDRYREEWKASKGVKVVE